MWDSYDDLLLHLIPKWLNPFWLKNYSTFRRYYLSDCGLGKDCIKPKRAKDLTVKERERKKLGTESL